MANIFPGKLLLLFLLIIQPLESYCLFQESINQELQANWFPVYLGDTSEEYTEFFINETRVYYYNSIEESTYYRDYYIKDSTLFLKRKSQSEFENMGRLNIYNDTLYIKNEEGISKYAKQSADLKLGDLINLEVSEDEFFFAYIERAAAWNEDKFN